MYFHDRFKASCPTVVSGAKTSRAIGIILLGLCLEWKDKQNPLYCPIMCYKTFLMNSVFVMFRRSLNVLFKYAEECFGVRINVA